MRECLECHRQFSSGASYRVHKHRFHRKMPVTEPETAPQETAQKGEEPEAEESEGQKPEDDDGKGSGGGAVLAIIGTIAAVGLAAWLSRKGN